MPSSPPRVDAVAGTTARPLVLVVDDNEKNLKLAREVLQRAGFATLEAAAGGEGLALARRHRPDLILLDLRLPDLDGTDAVRMLGSDPRTARIPVVALSAVRLGDEREWLRASGFAGYLEKPVDIGTFPDDVRRFLRASGST